MVSRILRLVGKRGWGVTPYTASSPKTSEYDPFTV